MAEKARLETGISDDGSSFTILEDAENLDDISGDKVDGDKEGDGEEKFFDFDSIPEDQRDKFKDTFGKMQTAFTEKTKGISDLKEKAGMADALVEKVNNLSTMIASQTQIVQPEKTVVDKKEEQALQFSFEKEDYYEPAFKEMAGVISGLKEEIVNLRNGISTDKKQTFEEKVSSFFNEAKLDKSVVMQMDKIATTMGKGVYNDLPKLAKLAKMELGLPLEGKTTTTTTDTGTKTHKRVGIKSQVESGNRRARDIEIKPAQSITEAWNQSEQELKNQE